MEKEKAAATKKTAKKVANKAKTGNKQKTVKAVKKETIKVEIERTEPVKQEEVKPVQKKKEVKKDNTNTLKNILIGVVILFAGVLIGFISNNPKTIPVLENGEEVLAKIDGKDFTANDLYAELKKQGGSQVLMNIIDEFISTTEIKDDTEARTQAESYLANLKAQYESYGYDFASDLKNAGYESEEEFLDVVKKDKLRTLAADKYIKENMISDSEVNEYYRDNIEGDMHVRYILITPEVNDDMTDEEKEQAEAKALQEANDVIAKLKDGEDFSDLASEHSDDASTASQGGLYDGFSKDDVVSEFWNASKALEDGKYTTTPVESSYGFFVIYRIKQDEKPAIESVKEEILDRLLTDKKTADENIIEKAWIKLRASYNLDIIDSEVEKSYAQTKEQYK